MKVRELLDYGFINLCQDADLEKEIKGVYVGDLLSYVMGNGDEGNLWVTVLGHLNIVAVAMLREFSCIVIADGVSVAPEVIDKANEEHLPILKTELNTYEVCKKLVEFKL